MADALAAGGRNARFARCDVTVEGDVAAALRSARDAFGPLAILVNNAGIEGTVAPLPALPSADVLAVLDVNVMGVFYGLKHALPAMAAAGSGAVVNVASVAGLTGFPLHAAYAASKHAVVELTRTAALEASARGVRVNAVCPGFTDTAMVEAGLVKMGQTREQLERRIPARRLATPDEIAAAVRYLCADAAAYVTGHALALDGGLVAG